MVEPVDLPDAGVPADHGLSSLGLLMQLAGHVLGGYAALATFVMMFGFGRGIAWILLVLLSSIARSMMHRSAGVQLLYGDRGTGEGDRLVGIRRYVIIALAQSVLVGVILVAKLDVGVVMTLAVVAALVAWPVTLAILMRLPRFHRYRKGLPIVEDKGFEGAAILMTVLGLCGVVGSGTGLAVLLDLPGNEITNGPGMLVVLALALLVVRSVIHVQAGIAGLRETSVDRAVELANRYANFGVISAFCAGAAMLLVAMTAVFDLAGLAIVCALVWMLMAWPMILRRFFADRQFADLMAGDYAPLHRRAPDAGITALGWLLLGYGVMMGAFVVPELVVAPDHGRTTLEALALFGSGVRSVWWTLGLAVLQAWAGFELIRMSPQSRVIATIYGALGIAVTCYVNWPLVQELRQAGFSAQSVAIGPLALALILPVATIVLVHRKISPTAIVVRS